MGYCAISGNSGGDSIKFPSTEEMPYRQYNRLCSNSIILSPAMNHNENSRTTASISLKCKGENDFSNPWLCFNYVSTSFESSAHQEIASSLDSIKIYYLFQLFQESPASFAVTWSRHPPPDVHLQCRPHLQRQIPMQAVCISRYGVKRREREENVSNSEKSPRTISQTAAALK